MLKNSSGGANGWDGQICQSIWYAFKYLKHLDRINVEYNEDIELYSSFSNMLIQSKVSQSPSSMNSNHNKYFIEGLNSLEEKNNDTFDRLVYSTNIHFPANIKEFWINNNSVHFDNLSEKVQNKIRNKSKLLQYEKLHIRHIPFDGDDHELKVQSIVGVIKDILEEITIGRASIIAKNMMNEWHSKMFYLASKKDDSIGYVKEQFIWSIVEAVLAEELSIENLEDVLDILNSESSTYEIQSIIQDEYDKLYHEIITDYKILSDVISNYTKYKEINFSLKRRVLILNFVRDYTPAFINEYLHDIVDIDLDRVTAGIFIFKIIEKRKYINNIKKVLNNG